jgi:hypothetical protein
MWLPIIEKAYAKVHGGYAKITEGRPYEALIDFTGKPTMSLSLRDEAVL